MKKNLENFHEILTVSKHSHSEVGFLHVISLGVSQKACRGGRWLPAQGGSLAACAGGGIGSPGGASAAHGGVNLSLPV